MKTYNSEVINKIYRHKNIRTKNIMSNVCTTSNGNNSNASLTRKWGEGWIEGVILQYTDDIQTYPAGTCASLLKHNHRNYYDYTKIKAISRMSSVNRVGITLRKENYIKMGEDIS